MMPLWRAELVSARAEIGVARTLACAAWRALWRARSHVVRAAEFWAGDALARFLDGGQPWK